MLRILKKPMVVLGRAGKFETNVKVGNFFFWNKKKKFETKLGPEISPIL